jgi:DNA primase
MPSIDFSELRRRVPIARVLELVGFRPVRHSGAELRGACPIHGSHSRQSRSFAANTDKNVFRCFHCGAGGNVLDLWAAIHKSDVYHAAISLCAELGMEPPEKTNMQR